MNTEHEDLTSGLTMSRRNFLRLGVAATAVGVTAAMKIPGQAAEASDLVYSASSSGEWSKLRPKADYASASVRFVENNSEWLGTSKIVGPIKNPSEFDMGFNRAARGLIDDKTRRGVLTFVGKHPLSGAISDTLGFIGSEGAVAGDPAVDGQEKYPIPDPEQMSRHIKDAAYFLRADEVGIGKMPEYAYYSEKTIVGRPAMLTTPPEECVEPFDERLPYVIVFMVDQDLETVQASTGYDGISASQSFLSYHATGNIAVIIAKYIRSLGYQARAHHARNYGAAMPPCAIAAGLGEFIRPGESVAHPRLGYRVKLAAVTTDMPLKPDKPIDFGAQDFCRTCMKCADNCPGGAITFDRDPVEHNGYLRWNSDSTKCTIFRTTNEEGSSCGRCMKVCPWNSKEDSWFHQAGTWIGSKGETASNFLKSIDDIFGYGEEQVEKYKWWLDWPEQYKVPPV